MTATPGLLYVTMQPKPGLPESQFHDWYNNEHGPTRLRLPFCTNGFRYLASDLEGSSPSESKPEWMALYDITDMATLTQDRYLRLRSPPVKSQREVDIMEQIKVDRKLYDYYGGQESEEFKRLEEVGNEGERNVMVVVSLDLHMGEYNVRAWAKWYEEEHIPMLSKVPGWLRTRQYITSSIDPKASFECVSLHEYKPQNGLSGPEFKAATSTKWAGEFMSKVVKEKRRRVYNLHYTFGPAPRHLAPNLADWQSSDPKTSITRTLSISPGGAGAIESFVTTPDGIKIPYRLEGSPNPSAPLIVLVNSILVDYRIWDDFIASFFSTPLNRKYRILRYLKRGRSSSVGDTPVTVDLLASDIIALLDALRVQNAAAVIGVSLGGATALNIALKYPSRVTSFISCDTSSKSPSGNSKAWGERIAVAEKENAISSTTTEAIVGQDLAEMTVRRWFVKESYDNPAMAARIAKVKSMVETNSLEGFKGSVQALYDYDLKEEMKGSEVNGLFVVGSGDGMLPGTMKDMADAYGKDGKGAGYEVIKQAGHLPMVEKPEEFSRVVERFLG